MANRVTGKVKRRSIDKKRVFRINRGFTSEVDRLSYSQLIRVVTILNANNPYERKEAQRIIKSILPQERKIINTIVSEPSKAQRAMFLRYIHKSVSDRNKRDTKNINTDLILNQL